MNSLKIQSLADEYFNPIAFNVLITHAKNREFPIDLKVFHLEVKYEASWLIWKGHLKSEALFRKHLQSTKDRIIKRMELPPFKG